MDTLKVNFPQDQEGYDRFEYTYEKALNKAYPMVWGPKLDFFGAFLKNNSPNNDNGAWVPAQLDAPRRKL